MLVRVADLNDPPLDNFARSLTQQWQALAYGHRAPQAELKQQLMELDNPLVRLELVSDVLERTGIAPG